MSEARSGRFEIDLDEIEKQLRRSVEAAPPPKNDPLAELARIVGQEDPFRGLFAEKAKTSAGGSAPAVAAAGPRDAHVAPPAPDAAETAELTARRREEASILHGAPAEDVFDPVTQTYGSLDNALEQEDFRPLQPRRSRKRLLAVGGLVVGAVVATAGGLAYRNGGKLGLGSGVPPIIKADNAPLKVAPENPGGMEIPNQNRQIYERATPEAQTRVVDAREQPVDVREAARNLPPAAPIGDPAQPVAPAAPSVAEPARPAGNPADIGRPARPNAVASALGEPRRVRTVAVRPDGTLFDGPPAPVAPATTPNLVPAASSLPPPVQVATIPISLGQQPAAASSAPAAPPSDDGAQGGAPVGPTVSVLPPQRPRAAGASTTPVAGRVAALPTDPAGEVAPASTSRAFTVQLGIRPSEAEARTASSQLAAKFAGDLGGRTPAVARAEVNGKTIYRMRVGPMSRDEATALCNRLKTAGGQCFIAQN